MELFLPILSALIGGAAAAANGVANDAVKRLYERAKTYLAEKFDEKTLAVVEVDPGSESSVELLASRLRQSPAISDPELQMLANELGNAVHELKKSDKRAAALIGVPLPLIMTKEEKQVVIATLPIGPAVKLGVVSLDDLAVALSKDTSAVKAKAIVGNANLLRARVDPHFPEDSICIALSSIPDPAFSGVYIFWFETLDEARRRGPRMVAALLLSLPLNPWNEVGEDAFDSLVRECGHA